MKKVHDADVADAAFDARNVRPVKIGLLCQFLLRQSERKSALPDCSAQRFARIGDGGTHVTDGFRFTARST